MNLSIFLFAAAGADVWSGLLDILVLLAFAALLGGVAERFRQSAVVGYIVAGTLVGPGALGWVADQATMLGIAELGVALLLFAIGLELSPTELKKLGRTTLFVGPLQVVLTTGVAAVVMLGCGFGPRESIVIGCMVALSSTACVLRVLRDRAEVDSPYGRVALGVLLVQDASVVPLVLLVTVLGEGGSLSGILFELVGSLLLAIVLVAGFYALFNWLMPQFLATTTMRRNRDLPVLLAVCMAGGAAWAAHAASLSPALGAFVAGVILAASPFAMQIQADIQPLRTVLVTLFFGAIGIVGDVAWAFTHLGMVLGIAAAIVVGKSTIITLLAALTRLPLRFAVAAGLSLAQIGEFSFVLATIARQPDVEQPLLTETAFNALVSATILTLLLTPYLMTIGPLVSSWLENLFKRREVDREVSEIAADRADAAAAGDLEVILVIGFGPAGQRVAEELMGRWRKQVTVVDLNMDNIRLAERYGLRARFGDATRTEVLEHLHIHKAQIVVIAVPEPTTVRRLIHQIRRLAPGVTLLVRCRYHIFHWEFLRAGVHAVVDEEENVGEKLAAETLAVLEPSRSDDAQS